MDDPRQQMLEVLQQHTPVAGDAWWMCRGCTWRAPLIDVDEDYSPAYHQMDRLAIAGLLR